MPLMNAPATRVFDTRYLAVIITAVVGMLATITAFVLMLSWEYRVAEIDFQSKAKSYLEVINADLGDANTLLYTIAAFISASDHPVSASEFAQFSAALHRRVAGLRDTGWAPRVTLAERPEFERKGRAAGIAAYQIKQFNPRHQLICATRRLAYYPLLYIEAGGTKRPMLGFDLTSEKMRARAALRALTTGQPAATRPMDVITVRQPGAGMLSYMSVHAKPARPGSGAQSESGIVLGVFDIPAMVENILRKKTEATGLNLYLFNPKAQFGRRVLYRSLSSGSDALSEHELLSEAHWQSTVVVIDQPIGAIVTPARPLHLVRWSLFGIVTLVVGLIMTATFVAYLLLSLRRTLQLEALTADLQATTDALHKNAIVITEMARHDALTQLPNRILFGERMHDAVQRFRRGAPFALLFLDLDRFKAVNDTLGHGVGDQLLCAVADRIRAGLREVDTAARLGGDEFAIVLGELAERATISIIANRLIESLSQPYRIDDQIVVIGVSIGAAIAADHVTAKSLMAEADIAMYEAKAAGRGTVRIFEQRVRAVG